MRFLHMVSKIKEYMKEMLAAAPREMRMPTKVVSAIPVGGDANP